MPNERAKEMKKIAKEAGFKVAVREGHEDEATFSRKDFPSEITLWSFKKSGTGQLDYFLNLAPDVHPKDILRKIRDDAFVLDEVTRMLIKKGYKPEIEIDYGGYVDVRIKIRQSDERANLQDAGKLLRLVDDYLTEKR